VSQSAKEISKDRMEVGGRSTHRVIHEWLEDGWTEARVQLAPEHGGRYVEA
jgi:hypothetical protein